MQVVAGSSARRPRRPRSRRSASATACQAARLRSRGGSAPVSARKIGTMPGRVDDDEQRDEDLAEEFDVHRTTVVAPHGGRTRRHPTRLGHPGAAATIRSYASGWWCARRAGPSCGCRGSRDEPVTTRPSSVGQRPHVRPLGGRVVLVVGLQPDQARRRPARRSARPARPAPRGWPAGGRRPARRRPRAPAARARTRRCPPWAAGSARRASRGANASVAWRPARRRISACGDVRPADRAAGRVRRRISAQLTAMPSARISSTIRSAALLPRRPHPGQLGAQRRVGPGRRGTPAGAARSAGSAPYQRQESSAPRHQRSPARGTRAAAGVPAGGGVVVGERDHVQPGLGRGRGPARPGSGCRRWRWSGRAGRCAARDRPTLPAPRRPRGSRPVPDTTTAGPRRSRPGTGSGLAGSPCPDLAAGADPDQCTAVVDVRGVPGVLPDDRAADHRPAGRWRALPVSCRQVDQEGTVGLGDPSVHQQPLSVGGDPADAVAR